MALVTVIALAGALSGAQPAPICEDGPRLRALAGRMLSLGLRSATVRQPGQPDAHVRISPEGAISCATQHPMPA